jgi:hypothetical protein
MKQVTKAVAGIMGGLVGVFLATGFVIGVAGMTLRTKVDSIARGRKNSGLALAEKGFEINPSLTQVSSFHKVVEHTCCRVAPDRTELDILRT